MTNHPNRKKAIATHRCPSGMGGVFDVIIVNDNGSGGVLVRVVGNGKDWNGHQFVVGRDELTPISGG